MIPQQREAMQLAADNEAPALHKLVDDFMRHQLTGSQPAMSALQNVMDATYEAGLELGRLRNFARDVMAVWPEGGMDGGDLQDIGVKHGLLTPWTSHEPCGESCSCAEWTTAREFAAGVVCYRKSACLLEGQP